MSTLHLKDRRILVVEDDYMIAQDVRQDLEKAGATILGPVPSVRKALRIIEAEAKIDGAVLDVNLGSEKSFQVAKALEMRAIPFLFATAYNLSDIPAEWRHAKIVMKPFRIAFVEQLLAAADSV